MEVRWRRGGELSLEERTAMVELAKRSASAPFGDSVLFDAWHATLPAERIAQVAVAVEGRSIVGLLAMSAIGNRTVTADRADADRPDRWQIWGETTDFGVVLLDHDHRSACWQAWFGAMKQRGVALLRLRNVRMGDPAVSAAFEVASRSGVDPTLIDRRRAPFVDLSSGFESWLHGRTKSQRKQFRRSLRAFRSLPDRTLELAEDPESLRAAVSVFLDLHRQRRGALGLSTVYDNDQLVDFLRHLAPRWAADGRLCAFIARSGSEPVGIELVIRGDTTWYSLNGGWRHDFAAHHVGTGLLLEAMMVAAEHGATRYSLLEGEEPYKMRMATGAHQLSTWDLHLRTAR